MNSTTSKTPIQTPKSSITLMYSLRYQKLSFLLSARVLSRKWGLKRSKNFFLIFPELQVIFMIFCDFMKFFQQKNNFNYFWLQCTCTEADYVMFPLVPKFTTFWGTSRDPLETFGKKNFGQEFCTDIAMAPLLITHTA